MSRKAGTGKYEQLLAQCANLEPIPTAVAHPCEATALSAAAEAGQKGLITPILVGPAARLKAIARAAHVDLGKMRLVDTPHSEASAWLGVELDAEANAHRDPWISRPRSGVSARVIPTNEKSIILRHTGALLGITSRKP